MDFPQNICVIGLFILNKAINIGINFNLQIIYSYSPYELNSHAHLISWVMPIKWNTMYITQTINRNQSVDKYLIYMFFMRQKGVLLFHNYSCHLPLPKLNHCKRECMGQNLNSFFHLTLVGCFTCILWSCRICYRWWTVYRWEVSMDLDYKAILTEEIALEGLDGEFIILVLYLKMIKNWGLIMINFLIQCIYIIAD